MRIILSIMLLVATTAYSTPTNLATKTDTVRSTEYEVFAQKYEIAFGEKPSDKVWNLGQKSCGVDCFAGCSGTRD